MVAGGCTPLLPPPLPGDTSEGSLWAGSGKGARPAFLLGAFLTPGLTATGQIPPRQLSQHEIPSHCAARAQQGAGLLFTPLFVSIAAPAQHGPSSPSARAWPRPRSRWGIAALFLAVRERSWRPWHAGGPHAPSLNQPLQELLGFAERERGAPTLLDPRARAPGEWRCRVQGLEKAEPRQLEGSHADMCISYKRRGGRNAGGKRNLHDSAHLTLIFSLSQPRIKPRYRVPLPGRASASRGGAAGV